MGPIYGLPYFGGKSGATGSPQYGKWIAGLLPQSQFYMEPFAGMLGVLLQKQKCKCEIVNDLDGLIYSFWKCVRDHPKDFYYKMENTLQCKQTFMDAIQIRENFQNGIDIPLLEIAHAVAVILLHGFGGMLSANSFTIDHNHKNRTQNFTRQLNRLHERLIDVYIQNTDALRLLDKYKDLNNATIYCDPPYPSSLKNGKDYNCNLSSINDFCDLLKKYKGNVAVSGYNDDFDQLDWFRSEKKCYAKISANSLDGVCSERVEILWTNYKPKKQKTLFDL